MAGQDVTALLAGIIEAHGGERVWNELEALEAVISVRGLLFTMKRRPVLRRVRVRAWVGEPRFTFLDFPSQGQIGELAGDREVRITDRDGRVLARRTQPRSAFRGLRRAFYWDTLDFLYFGGYATWNYLVTPFLFLRSGFTFEPLEPAVGPDGPWPRLSVTFPESIPTHCRKQVFWFDRQLLLRRLDYTPEVIGSWAHAAHLCDDYRDFGGLKVPTRRRVRPIFSGDQPAPWPTLVALDTHEVRPVPSAAGSAAP